MRREARPQNRGQVGGEGYGAALTVLPSAVGIGPGLQELPDALQVSSLGQPVQLLFGRQVLPLISLRGSDPS